MTSISQFGREMRMARRLFVLGCGDVFGGTVQEHERMNLLRQRILSESMHGHVVAVTEDDRNITFAMAFKATYGEPLIQQEVAA